MFRLINSHLQVNTEQCKVHNVRAQWDPISFTDALYTFIKNHII
jgi:hypothetical protein